jgi:hypothetical protein
MAPLLNMHETGQMPTQNLPKLPSSSFSTSSEKSLSNGLRKKRLQHYIKKLKKAIINYDSNEINKKSLSKKHMSTFEVLERAIQLVSDKNNSLSSTSSSSHSSQWLKSNLNEQNNNNQMPTNITSHPTSDESAPPSPSASTTTTSTSSSVERHNDRQQQSQSPSSQTLLSNISSTIIPPTTSDRLWGTVMLSLPDGIITNLWSSNNEECKELPNFTNVLKIGSNLLELLQGKGAQTLLLNAFCGSSKRRKMYARLNCENIIRPFEFICEFTPNSSNPSICFAKIQILCLESAFKKSSSTAPTIFTTRHNASCALIYLDAA